MRKGIVVFLGVGLLVLGLSNLALAYPRTVLLEDFTNWG